MTSIADVQYILRMRPDVVRLAADEFARVPAYLAGAHQTAERARRGVSWSGRAADGYQASVSRIAGVVDDLRDPFKRAATAVGDYADAQEYAKRLAEEAVELDARLGALIASAVPTFGVDAMSAWPTVRLLPVPAVNAIREEGDQLYGEAQWRLADARRSEELGRADAVAALDGARGMLPDPGRLPAGVPDGPLAPAVLARSRVLDDRPNARRPSPELLTVMQAPNDTDTAMYPGDTTAAVGRLVAGDGFHQREVTTSEKAALDALNPWQKVRYLDIVRQAETFGAETYPTTEEHVRDGFPDALKHSSWSAMLTDEFGADTAARLTTAHEAHPAGQAKQSEAMDLWNNAMGQQVTLDHPELSGTALTEAVHQQVEQGHALVVGPDGKLAYSDQVDVDQTGQTH